jgi:hypothetical protein
VAKRRTRGEGSIHQRCITGVCPDLVDGNRPDHKCTGTWVGVVDLGKVGGKRVRKTVTAPTLRELRPKFKKLKSDTDSGVSHEDMTVREWFEHWLEHEVDRKRRPATANTYRRYVEKWVMPELGHLRLDRLRPAHLEALYARMQDEGKADATRRQVHAIIRRALVIAERQRLISWNPATKVDAPAVGKGSHGKFTLEEARRSSTSSMTRRCVARVGRWPCSPACVRVRPWGCGGRTSTSSAECSSSTRPSSRSPDAASRSWRRSRTAQLSRGAHVESGACGTLGGASAPPASHRQEGRVCTSIRLWATGTRRHRLHTGCRSRAGCG